jgi:hypothetical protein
VKVLLSLEAAVLVTPLAIALILATGAASTISRRTRRRTASW